MLNRNSVRLTFQLNSLEKVEREQHALIEKLSISELIYMGKTKESRTCDLFFRCSLGQLQVHCRSHEDICGLILVDAMDNLGICVDDMFEAEEVDRNLSVSNYS